METDSEQPDWELSKENFQPLRQGRRGAGLKDNTEEFRSASLDVIKRRATWVGHDVPPDSLSLEFVA